LKPVARTGCVIDGKLDDQTTLGSDMGLLNMVHPMGPAQAKAIACGTFLALRVDRWPAG